MPHRVLDERLHGQERDHGGEHLGAICSVTVSRSPNRARFQPQVAVDRAQLLGERREVAVPAEGVAGEVGELEHQLAGLRGVGVDERRDRVERVVDEVRLICARRARTSASGECADASSSPSSTWAATQSATSPVARTSPARTGGERDDRPDGPVRRRGSGRHGSVSASPIGMRRCTCGPDSLGLGGGGAGDRAHRVVAVDRDAPARSLIARPRSRAGRAGGGRPIASPSSSPAQVLAARLARCSVWYVARSTSVPSSRRDHEASHQQHDADGERLRDDAEAAAASSIDSGMRSA